MRCASFSRLGREACGARVASTSGAMPLTKSCAINPAAKTQRPAFIPWANLALPVPSSTGSRGCAARDALLLLMMAGPIGRDRVRDLGILLAVGKDTRVNRCTNRFALDGSQIMTRALRAGMLAA